MTVLTNANRASNLAKINGLMGPSLQLAWGKPIARLGYKRSADGAVFLLSSGKVAKFVMCATKSDLAQAEQEYLISKMAYKAGVGPAVYNSFVVPVPPEKVQNVRSLLSHGSSFIQTAFVIIMENLEAKPLMTLQQYLDAGNPLPRSQLKSKMEKMHAAGIWHGDMHLNNILVQIQPSGKPKIIIIDYGRSLSGVFGNANQRSLSPGNMRYNRNMYNTIKGYARVYNTTPKKAVGRLNLGSLVKVLNATGSQKKKVPPGLHKTPKTKRLRIGKKLCLAMAIADLRRYAKFAGVSDEGTKEQICERLYRLV
jgi:hypothetical protein